MLVNVKAEIRYLGMPSQFQALRMQVKQFCEVGAVLVSSNLSLTLREKVKFQRSSKSLDMHNSERRM